MKTKRSPGHMRTPLTFALTSGRKNDDSQMEEDVTEARNLLESILKQRANTPVNLERASVQTKCGTCTYYVDFPGFQVCGCGGMRVPSSH